MVIRRFAIVAGSLLAGCSIENPEFMLPDGGGADRAVADDGAGGEDTAPAPDLSEPADLASAPPDLARPRDLAPPLTCSDGKRGGDESDVDCGGSCLPCAVGKKCAKPGDCLTGVCTGGTCRAAATCMNGMKDATESDVDCGGPLCAGCANGRACETGGDCASGFCMAGTCRDAPRCDDKKKNGGESDVAVSYTHLTLPTTERV